METAEASERVRDAMMMGLVGVFVVVMEKMKRKRRKIIFLSRLE